MGGMRLTLTDVSECLFVRDKIQVPAWKLRRVIDGLEAEGKLEVQRVRSLRTVLATDVPTIADELNRTGWKPKCEEAAAC